MKRLLKLFALLFVPWLFLSSAALGTTTVTGKLQTLKAGSSTNAFVRFWLRGCGGNYPRVNGVALIGASDVGYIYSVDLTADANGNISGTLYSTRDATGLLGGDIECGGSTTSVFYGMQVFINGNAGPEIPIHAKSGTIFDISNVTPISTPPVVTAPNGDSTYARLDGGNTPFTGTIRFAGKVFMGQLSGGTLSTGSIATAAISSPTAPIVTPNTTGSTTYTYYCSALDASGTETPPSSATQITNGNATPNNSIACSYPTGAVSLNIYKTNTSTLLATLTNGVSSFTDTGQSTTAHTAPAINLTASISSPVFHLNVLNDNATPGLDLSQSGSNSIDFIERTGSSVGVFMQNGVLYSVLGINISGDQSATYNPTSGFSVSNYGIPAGGVPNMLGIVPDVQSGITFVQYPLNGGGCGLGDCNVLEIAHRYGAATPACNGSTTCGWTGLLDSDSDFLYASPSNTASLPASVAWDLSTGRVASGVFGVGNGTPGNTNGAVKTGSYQTDTNCANSSGSCGSASMGRVSIAAAATTVTVSDSRVSANSGIFIQEDSTLGSALSVTCNTTTGRTYTVTARTAGTSFQITASAAPTTNPACLSFWIVN